MPQLIYDQMMLIKLLPGSVLEDLEENMIKTSEELNRLRFAINDSTAFQLIKWLRFKDPSDKEFDVEKG